MGFSVFFFLCFTQPQKEAFFPQKEAFFPQKWGVLRGAGCVGTGRQAPVGAGSSGGIPDPPQNHPPVATKWGTGMGRGSGDAEKGWAGSERGGREGVGGEDWGWGEVARGDFGGYPKKKRSGEVLRESILPWASPWASPRVSPWASPPPSTWGGMIRKKIPKSQKNEGISAMQRYKKPWRGEGSTKHKTSTRGGPRRQQPQRGGAAGRG